MVSKMITNAQIKDRTILHKVQKLANDFGAEETILYPISCFVEVKYKVIGDGSIIAGRIDDFMQENYPDRHYKVNYSSSDMKLTFKIK
jgi:hypothetical protein